MQAVQDKSEVTIGEYLNVLRRRWPWILLSMLLLGGLALANGLRTTPTYVSSAELLLQSRPSEGIFEITSQSTDPDRAVQNELKIINSRTVKSAVAKAYGSPIGVTARSGGESDVIILSASSSDPEKAARMVNVYAETYQSARVDAQLQDLSKARRTLQEQLDQYQEQIDDLDAPVALIDAQILEEAEGSDRYQELTNQRTRLVSQTQARRNELQEQLSDYSERLQSLQVSTRLVTTGGVQILNPAQVPSTPVSPTIPSDVVQALLIGAFLGIGLAFVRDQIDDSIRTKADMERTVRSVPTIGLVPADPAWRNDSTARISSSEDPMSATAEAYRSLRTTIQYLGLGQPMNLIQVTSASSGEGKSSLVTNLAITFAQAGRRVAVVGCDLRKPRLQSFFKVDGSIGLTSVLVGDISLAEAVQTSPVHPNIAVLASGPLPPNPSELLSLDRTSSIIRSLLDDHHYVLLDCPPVLPVTDALVLSRVVDATIFLASANKTTRRKARRAVEMLQQVDSPLIGAVLNGVSGEGSYGSLYEYYGYVRRSRVPLLGRFLKPKPVPIQSAGALRAEEPAG